MLKCAIIDDEQPARKLIAEYIKKVPSLSLVGEYKNPIEAMTNVAPDHVDILFLDIQMPGLTGLEFIKTLNKKPNIIFTTAYSEYALESYDLDVVDYLLKPIAFDRFLRAINKVHELQSKAAMTNVNHNNYLMVKSDGQTHRILIKDILYIEGLKEYVSIYTSSGRVITLESLKNLETTLPVSTFCRVHKSYIVNISLVNSHSNHDLMIGAKKIPIGVSYRDEVLNKLF
ncbi:MAG: LytTR family DNA-binding domain-containing protein [Marinoscillum sp.]|jgi:DNA-binding LytR/AlgR family response regulator